MVHHLDGVITNATQQIDYLQEQIAESESEISRLEDVQESLSTAISRHKRVVGDLQYNLSQQQFRLQKALANKAESEA